MHILIIEDDERIRQELKQLLENALYRVTTTTDYDTVAEKLQKLSPDLILLDVNLPGISGFELCRTIRSHSDVPVIFVTSRTDSMDELNGMLNGGDDYITKPFHAPILLAHIAAVLKRCVKAQTEPVVLSHKGVELNMSRGCVYFQDKQIDLSKNELKILYYLFIHKTEIVSRMDLIDYLWDQKIFIDDNALSVNVTRLRSKLNQIGICNFIETKRGLGYRI